MELSARNVLKGKVKSIVTGMVNSEIVIELPGGAEITSIITKTSAENLKLKEGSDVYAIIKASNVMIVQINSFSCFVRENSQQRIVRTL
jgi:molybdopterin-binding protein